MDSSLSGRPDDSVSGLNSKVVEEVPHQLIDEAPHNFIYWTYICGMNHTWALELSLKV